MTRRNSSVMMNRTTRRGVDSAQLFLRHRRLRSCCSNRPRPNNHTSSPLPITSRSARTTRSSSSRACCSETPSVAAISCASDSDELCPPPFPCCRRALPVRTPVRLCGAVDDPASARTVLRVSGTNAPLAPTPPSETAIGRTIRGAICISRTSIRTLRSHLLSVITVEGRTFDPPLPLVTVVGDNVRVLLARSIT